MTFRFICSTAFVTLAGAALFLVPGDEPIRYLTATIAVLAIAVLTDPWRALARRPVWRTATASAYSAESSGTTNGCDGSPLHDADLTVATFLVPCGARIRICLGRRCVTATRKDSGPYAPGRQLDLNLGVVRALGFPSCAAFGVRTVTWSRA